MERDSKILTAIAEEYHLDINGIKFWTPYWINWSTAPYFQGAPYAGKGTPGQLQAAFESRLGESTQQPKSAKEYQSLMRSWGLGIDCSGLAYYMLSHWLRQVMNLRLSDHIYVPKADVVAASKRPHWQRAGVSSSTISALSNQVSVAEVCRLFHRHPMRTTNVARLTSKEAVSTVGLVADAKPGDMIKMTGPDGDHLGVVVRVDPKVVRYVESRGFKHGPGSVRYQDILIKDPTAGLEKQDWDDRKNFNPRVGDRLCRLKVLDGRA